MNNVKSQILAKQFSLLMFFCLKMTLCILLTEKFITKHLFKFSGLKFSLDGQPRVFIEGLYLAMILITICSH